MVEVDRIAKGGHYRGAGGQDRLVVFCMPIGLFSSDFGLWYPDLWVIVRVSYSSYVLEVIWTWRLLEHNGF